MNAQDKSALDRYARRIALADALVRAEDLDDEGLAALEAALRTRSEFARGRLGNAAGAAPKRRFGLLKGELVVPPEFFEPMSEDELRDWEGE